MLLNAELFKLLFVCNNCNLKPYWMNLKKKNEFYKSGLKLRKVQKVHKIINSYNFVVFVTFFK